MGPVVWVGGAPAAGKSTVARALARRYGLRLYGADTRTEFVCECGHPGCERLVRLRMADYRSPCLAEH